MKRYIKSSIDNTLKNIKKSIEDFAEYYYSCIGYKESEYPKPDCKIESDGTSFGKLVYRISIEFYTVREQDAPAIWSKLDNIAASEYPEYEIYKNFYQARNKNTFVGFIKEGNDISKDSYGFYDSIEEIIKAANHVSDSEYYYWLDEQLSDYCDAMDWDWDNFPSEDIKFLNENPEWRQYIQDNIM